MAYLYLRYGREVWIGFTDKQGVKRQQPTLLPALEHPTYRTVNGGRSVKWPPDYKTFLSSFEYKIAHDNVGMGDALNPNYSFEKLFAEFLESRRPPKVAPATVVMYKLAKAHLVAFYPNPPLQFLTPKRLVTFRNHLLDTKGKRGKPLTATTVNSYLRSLCAFFTWAVKSHYLPESPINEEVMVEPDTKEVPNFSPDQLATLLHESVTMMSRKAPKGCTPMYDLIRFLLLSGFRIGEAVGLRWDQVHFDEGYIALRSKDGTRIDQYPLNVELRTFLEALPRLYAPRVFMYADKSHPSHFVTHVAQRKKWGKCRDAEGGADDPAKEGRLSIHTLRKNFGTYMAGLGMPPQKLQELMRHENFATTKGYYLKVKIDENRAELDARESLLAHIERIKRTG